MVSRLRDKAGYLRFPSFSRPNDSVIGPADALLIGELRSTYISAGNKDPLSPNTVRSTRLVISTPNADYLPQVNVGNQIVSLCVDGRWGAEDWTQWPQWYLNGLEHLPFILRRPKAADLISHPLRRLWWTMSEADLVPSPDSPNDGRLSPSVVEEFQIIRNTLMQEVEPFQNIEYQKLRSTAAQMRYCVSALKLSVTTFTNLMVLVATTQHYCLETRAMLDKIKKWDQIPIIQRDGFPSADHGIIGCVTDHLPLVDEMCEKGVPVWLVRSPSMVPMDTNVVKECLVMEPKRAGIATQRLFDKHYYYQGPISPEIYLSVSRWKPGLLDMTKIEVEVPPLAIPVLFPSTSAQASAHSLVMGGKDSRCVQPYSKTREEKRILKAPQTLVNMGSFQRSTSPYSSQPLELWADALAAVNTESAGLAATTLTHPRHHYFKGYAFPNAYILSTDEAKSMEMTLAWLAIRTKWLSALSSLAPRASPLPHSQQWRAYLREVAMDLEFLRPDPRKGTQPQRQSNKKLSHTARRNEKSRIIANEIFTIQKPCKEEIQSLTWNGRVVWRPGYTDLSNSDRQLVAWDVQEHNFCLELLNLDRCVLETAWRSTDGAHLCEEKIRAVFPHECLSFADLPSDSVGLSSKKWEERRPYVEAFHCVLADWPGAPSGLLPSIPDKTSVWDRVTVERVETLAARFYCQTFFDYFTRAACIPHIFPSSG